MDSMDNLIEEALKQPEPPIADDRFSDFVMNRLPRKQIVRSHTRRWTLAAAATTGSLLTILLTPPIKTVFGLYSISGYQTTIASAALLAAVITVPFVWLLNAER